MSILNFMPQFVPWYTKSLLKKDEPEIEDAKAPSTGFFGDVFDFIDDAFTWEPRPEPETNWGGGQLGAGFGEQAPAYEPFIEPDYSGMGDPFGMADPFTEEDWVSAPSTPSPWTGSILGGMFGQAPPTPGIGSAIGGSLGSGEGWGFDLIDEPAQSWDMYAPPPTPAPWTGGVTGGMFAPPEPMSFPDIGNQWGSAWNDWSAPPEPAPFASDLGFNFRDSLANSLSRDEAWADVQDMRATPAPELGTSSWDALPLSGVPGNGIGAAIGDTFSGFGSNLGARIQEPIDLQQWEPWGGEWAGGVRGAGVVTPEYSLRNDWSMFGNGDTGLGMMPDGWDQMSPQERGEYVYFSGLKGEDYLSDSDWARMSPDLQQKIGYADSRVEGGISNGFSSLWNTIETPFNAAYETIGDAVVDPIFQPLDSTGNRISPFQKDFWSKGPSLNIGTGTPSQVDFAIPLEDTVQNIQDATNPWDFLETQGDAFKERPLTQQIGIPFFTPGSGIYKNIEGAPQWLRTSDSIIDLLQGGAALDNIGDIPGASSAFRNVIAPGGAGFVAGAGADALFDPTYTDQWGNEYNPSWWESGLGVGATFIAGNQARKMGTVPFGAGLRTVDDPLVSTVLAHLDATDLARTADAGTARSALYGDQARIAREVFEQYGPDRADEAARVISQRLSGVNMAQIGDLPPLTPEDIRQLKSVVATNADELKYGPISKFSAIQTIDKWVDPLLENPAPSELANLRAILTGQPPTLRDVTGGIAEGIQPSMFDEVGSVVPPRSAVDVAGNVNAPRLLDETPEAALRPTTSLTDTPPTGGLPPYQPNDWEIAGIATRDDTVEKARMEFVDRFIDYAPVEIRGEMRSEWERLGIATRGDAYEKARMEFIDRLTPYIPPAERPRFFNEWELATGVKSTDPFPSDVPPVRAGEGVRPRSKEELEFIDRMTPYVPMERRPRLLSEWEATMGEDATSPLFRTDAPMADTGGMARPRSKAEVEFIDSLMEYVPPAERVDMRNAWERTFDVPLPGRVDPLATTDLAGRPIVKGKDLPVTDATTLPKPVAEFIDAGPVSPRAPDAATPVVEDWRKKTVDALGGTRNRAKRQEIVDRAAAEVEQEVRAITTPYRAESLVSRAKESTLAQLQKIEDAAIADDIKAWRESVDWELDKMEVKPKFLGKTRGSLSTELADGLDRAGTKLEDLLKEREVPDEVIRDLVEKEQIRYIEERFARKLAEDPKDAMVEHLMISLHEGRWKPKMPNEVKTNPLTGVKSNTGIVVDSKVGQVAPWIRGGKTLSQKWKNQVFGLTDFGAAGLNAIPAAIEGGGSFTLGWLNRLLNVMGTGMDMTDIRRTSPLYIKSGGVTQDILNKEAGTVIGGLSNIAGDFGVPGAALAPFRKLDALGTAWNDALAGTQYKTLMTDGMRKPIYEGNLVLMKLLGQDTASPAVRRAAGNMADAVTSAATLARGNTRRDFEAMMASSAMFTRAQGNVLVNVGKLLNGTGPERIMAASTIVTMLAAWGIAAEVAGNHLDVDPIKDGKFNNNFGKLTLPVGGDLVQFQLFNNSQVGRVAARSLSALVNVDPNEMYETWAGFLLGRTSPLPATILKGSTGIGYDPRTGANLPPINLPGEKFDLEGQGEGVGVGLSYLERAMANGTLPANASSYILNAMDEEGETPSVASVILTTTGLSAYDLDAFNRALRAEGVTTMDELIAKGKKADPLASEARIKREFYVKNPTLKFRGDSGVVKELTRNKENEWKEFESGELSSGEVRKNSSILNAQIVGAFKEIGIEPDEPPKEGTPDRWQYDYSQMFQDAMKKYTDGTVSSIVDNDVLGELQSEFWAKHTDPKVRKEILAYQMANKQTDAERMYYRDLARLNGFDPDTGEPLKYPGGDPMPSYFDIDRYNWIEVPNDESKEFYREFEEWKRDQDEEIRGVDKEKLIKYYITTEPTYATRKDGTEWDAISIRDLVNYGRDSQMTPTYKFYRELMKPELLWFDEDATWGNITKAHEAAGRN